MRSGGAMKSLRRSLCVLLLASVAAGCGGKGDDGTVKQAVRLALNTPITAEDSPADIIAGFYMKGPRMEIYDSEIYEKYDALATICCTGGKLAITAEDDAGPFFVERLGDAPVQPHRDYVIGTLAAAGVPKNSGFVSSFGTMYTLDAFTHRAMWELDIEELSAERAVVRGAGGNELGWTLRAMAEYADLYTPWKDAKGRRLDVEKVLAAALKRRLGWGSCAGTHELAGIAALVGAYGRDHTAQPGGVWAEAARRVEEAIALARKNQGESGAFGARWFESGAIPEDPVEALHYTGHVLDFVVMNVPAGELEKPWVRLAAEFLAEQINYNIHQVREMETLAVAAHALRVYLERKKK
ncbi:MAG: hypothetical protein AB1742_13680 [bacterium]